MFGSFMPLVLAALVTGGASPATSWTFVGSTTSTTGSVSVHGSAVAGDLAILYQNARNSSGSAPALVLPSGFVAISGGFSDSINRVRMSVSAKILTSAGGSVTGMDGTSSDGKTLAIFRANAPLTGFTVQDLEEYYGSGNPPTKTINASAAASACIVLCSIMAVSGSATYSGINSNPNFDADLTVPTGMAVGYKIYNSSPADHTYDGNDGSAFDGVAAFYLTGTT